jgi:hypothetical protein
MAHGGWCAKQGDAVRDACCKDIAELRRCVLHDSCRIASRVLHRRLCSDSKDVHESASYAVAVDEVHEVDERLDSSSALCLLEDVLEVIDQLRLLLLRAKQRGHLVLQVRDDVRMHLHVAIGNGNALRCTYVRALRAIGNQRRLPVRFVRLQRVTVHSGTADGCSPTSSTPSTLRAKTTPTFCRILPRRSDRWREGGGGGGGGQPRITNTPRMVSRLS